MTFESARQAKQKSACHPDSVPQDHPTVPETSGMRLDRRRAA